MSTNDAERKAFETLCCKRWHGDRDALTRHEPPHERAGEYVVGPIQFAFAAFQAGRAQALAEVAAMEPVAWLLSMTPAGHSGPTLFFTAPSDQRGFPVYTLSKWLKRPCGQINSGAVCLTPRSHDERLCPDCNPRPQPDAPEGGKEKL